MNTLRALLLFVFSSYTAVAHAGYYVTDNNGQVTGCYAALGMAVNAWQNNFITSAPTTISAIDTTAMTVTWFTSLSNRVSTWGTCSGTPLSASTATYTNGAVDPAYTSGGSNFTPGDLALITSLQSQATAQQAQLSMLSQQVVAAEESEPQLTPQDASQLAWLCVSLLAVGFTVKQIKAQL